MAEKLVTLFIMCIVVVATMLAHGPRPCTPRSSTTASCNAQDACKVAGDSYPHCDASCAPDMFQKKKRLKGAKKKKIHSSTNLFGNEIFLKRHLALIESMVFICVRTDKLNRKLK